MCNNGNTVELCLQQKICWSHHPWYLWMGPYLETEFANIITVKRVGPNPRTGVFIRRQTFRQRHRKENAMWRWRKRLEWCIYQSRHTNQDCQKIPGAGMEAWNRSSLRVPRRNQRCQYLGFKLVASRTMREYVSAVLSQLICGTSFRQP